MNETMFVALCGSSVLVAVVSLIGNIVTFKMNRKAKVEDEEKEDDDKLSELDKRVTKIENIINESNSDLIKSIGDMAKLIDNLRDGQKIILYDRILSLSQEYIKSQSITFNQKKDLHNMHSIYHNKLGGNGDLDNVLKDVDKIKVDYEDA